MANYKATITVESTALQDLLISDPAGGLIFNARAEATTSHVVDDKALLERLIPALVQIDDRDEFEIEVVEG